MVSVCTSLYSYTYPRSNPEKYCLRRSHSISSPTVWGSVHLHFRMGSRSAAAGKDRLERARAQPETLGRALRQAGRALPGQEWVLGSVGF